jgi:pantoate--beta-alanine ligase
MIYRKPMSSQHLICDGLENQMEGKFRPGHFVGVGTIVRLLKLRPQNAYFGEKFPTLKSLKNGR